MPLTIHHLQVSQSERILWLAEELQIPYTLVLHRRDPIFSPASIKALHPLGQAPIIQDDTPAGRITLAESGACVEYIVNRYGSKSASNNINLNLVLPPSHPDYHHYLYHFHLANGGLQPTSLRLLTLRSAGLADDNAVVRRTANQLDDMLRLLDDRLRVTGAWLAGDAFTLADIMIVFTLTTMRTFGPVDLSAFANVLAYLQRAVQRDGYRRARERGDPDLELMVDGKPPGGFVERLRAEGRI